MCNTKVNGAVDTFMTTVGKVLAEKDTLLAPILEELIGYRVLKVNKTVPFTIKEDSGIYTLCHLTADMETIGETAIAIFWDGRESGDIGPTSRAAHTELMKAWNMYPMANDRALYSIVLAPHRVVRDAAEVHRVRPDKIVEAKSGRMIELTHSEIIYVDYSSVAHPEMPAVTSFCKLLMNHLQGDDYYTNLAEAVYSRNWNDKAPVGVDG